MSPLLSERRGLCASIWLWLEGGYDEWVLYNWWQFGENKKTACLGNMASLSGGDDNLYMEAKSRTKASITPS